MFDRLRNRKAKSDPKGDRRQRAALSALDKMGSEAAKELAFIELLAAADRKAKS